MRINTALKFALLMLLLTPAAFAGDITQEDVNNIIQKIDELYRSQSSYSEFEMEIVTPHWQRTLVMEAWTQGMNKTFIRIEAPKKDKGITTLRIENEMWNYLPKTNKVIKIPPSMMMSSWMGSDFTNDDLVKEFSLFEDYRYELVEVDEGRDDLVYINCIPREDLPVVWGNIVIAAQREDYIPVWQKFYDEEGRLMRIWTYGDLKTFGQRTIPATMEMIPQTKEGHKTIMRYTVMEFDKEVGDDVFTLKNLRSGN